MQKITTKEFESIVDKKNTPYLLKFGSKTCGPCNTMKPVLEKLATENPDFKIYEIDTDESPDLAAHFSIRSVPTMHFCENREIIYSTYGVTPFRDLQYIIDNINDSHLREHGEFQQTQQKKSHFGAILICVIIAFLVLLMVL